NGDLINFDLSDYSTIFVPSTAPLVGEGLWDLPVEIRDYPNRNTIVTEISSGDPVHFCLGPNGPPDHIMGQLGITWEFSDDQGMTWTTLISPPFSDYCFPILPGILEIDCAQSNTGFVDRLFRAKMTAFDPDAQQSCDYFSEEVPLRIRCPLTDVAVAITPDGPACAGDVIDFSVNLETSHQWLLNLDPNTQIDWCLEGPFAPGNLVDFQNSIAFTYEFTVPAAVQTTTYCFTAKITDCGQVSSFQACFSADPEPDAGNIIGLPFLNPTNLNLISGPPNPVYTICPGDDAVIGQSSSMPFQNCRPQWQYTFDNPFSNPSPLWIDMGLSNSVQNTNILPSHHWPANAETIYYRHRCDPLSDPSGCLPDYSDTLSIRLIAPPNPVTLSGPTQFCTGEEFELEFTPFNLGSLSYTWFMDGVEINHLGNSYTGSSGGNYQVVVNNGCTEVVGPVFTVEECTLIAAISCPLDTNECVVPGSTTVVSAAASQYSCEPSLPLSFEWSIDGVFAGTGEELAFEASPNTSPTVPTTIQLTVTGGGCTSTTTRIITPCGTRN
ncbi:MAG: hypothetical protein AAFQ37_06290, partial [Bacteroidota bacterium]